MKPIKGKVMTQAEEVRELRNWLRAQDNDARASWEKLHQKIDQNNRELHKKVDDGNMANSTAHAAINERIGCVNTKTGINTAKLGLFVTLLTVFVAALASTGFSHLAGQ